MHEVLLYVMAMACQEPLAKKHDTIHDPEEYSSDSSSAGPPEVEGSAGGDRGDDSNDDKTGGIEGEPSQPGQGMSQSRNLAKNRRNRSHPRSPIALRLVVPGRE